MTVEVFNGEGGGEPYKVQRFHNVSAVGIGHLRQDLVLVFPKTQTTKERAEELGVEWSQIHIMREERSEP